MGTNQIVAMLPSLEEVYRGISGADDLPTLMCTLESTSRAGAAVWIQAMPGTVNMGYPFNVEPFELLRQRAVRTPGDIYLVEWVADEYATFGFGDLSPRDHASLLDQVFVKVLGCDDDVYEIRMSLEQLDS